MSNERIKTLPAQSLARGIEVLEFIAFSRRAVRLKDVADAFGLDMASTHRILRTLEELSYVSRLPIGKTYGPGPKLRELSASFTAPDRMIETLQPLIVELADVSGQVAHIAVLRENHAVLVEVALSSEAKISIRQAPGDIDELYCSAVGKSLLAFLPDFERNALLRTITFEELTPYTITNLTALRRELQSVRETGISYDDRENDTEISCIGAPILDSKGYAIASLGISTLAMTLSKTIREEAELIQLVKQAAERASAVVRATDEGLVAEKIG